MSYHIPYPQLADLHSFALLAEFRVKEMTKFIEEVAKPHRKVGQSVSQSVSQSIIQSVS